MLQYLEQNQMLIVLSIVLILWAGIAALLFVIESRLKRVEARIESISSKEVNTNQ